MERYLTKKEKIRDFREKYLPTWAILPLVSIVILNCLIYWGSGMLTASRYHFDFTSSLDRAVPLIPQFVWIYILAFPFWAANYILAAKRWILSLCGNRLDGAYCMLCNFSYFTDYECKTWDFRQHMVWADPQDGLSGRRWQQPVELISVHSLLRKLAELARSQKVREDSEMVSAFFTDFCSFDHYFHAGVETTLSGGCHCGSGDGGTGVEILQQRKTSWNV